MSEHPGTGRRGEAPGTAPEAFDRDLDLKAIAVTAVGLGLLVVAAMALMWWLGVGLRQAEQAKDPPPRPLPEPAGRQLPPEPRLQGAPGSAFEERQGAPELELRRMRQEEEEALSSYGWIDREGGVARIPVERAMELLAERGLPAPEPVEEAEPAAGGTAGGSDG